jgi:hypothetical protein
VSSGDWTLDQDSELNVVVPWLDGEPDATNRESLLEWLAGLLRDPDRPRLMDTYNVFSVQLPRTNIVVIWHLDVDNRTVQVSHIGSA